MSYNYSNTALSTTLNGDISDTDTSLTVVNANGYPSVPFKIRVDTEIIVVGAKSGKTFSSLERGHEDSLQSAHSSGDEVMHVVTAEDIPTFPGSWLSAMFARPSGEHVDDDDFNDGDIGAEWSTYTQTGTTTWEEGLDVLSARTWSQSGSDASVIVKPMTGATTYPITIETAMRVAVRDVNYLMAGMAFTDGTSGASKCVLSMPYWSSSYTWYNSFRSGTLDNVSSTYTNIAMNNGSLNWPWLYQRLVWVSANSFKYGWSVDGVIYDYVGNYSVTMTPTHYGVWVSSWGTGTPALASFEYFRVTESDLSV